MAGRTLIQAGVAAASISLAACSGPQSKNSTTAFLDDSGRVTLQDGRSARELDSPPDTIIDHEGQVWNLLYPEGSLVPCETGMLGTPHIRALGRTYVKYE